MSIDDYREHFLSGKPQLIATAVAQLACLASEKASEILRQLITDVHPKVRARVAIAAHEINLPNVEQLVLPLLDDQQDYVRWHACEILHFRASRNASAKLLGLMSHDVDPFVRNRASIALGTIGSLDDVPVMEKAAIAEHDVDHEGSPISLAIARSIQLIHERHAIK